MNEENSIERREDRMIEEGDRWNHLRKILERSGPFSHPDFEPNTDNLDFLLNNIKILIVGAGGLGCELIKNLALLGFRNIHLIDMDTIDISNLNRQFLFRMKDVGQSKAEVAASFINKRIHGTKVIPHFARIEDKDERFYKDFSIIVCGLDSIIARRWLNGMIMSLLEYDEDGNVDQTTIIPIVDGGTEGFKGNVRVILPSISPCIECTLDLYPPQLNYPLCTLAHTPRLPEHCIEYVRILLWPKENPFDNVSVDGDDPTHINWIYEKAVERANEFKITGVSYRLTQGVVKRIIPAVASTNAVIAAICSTEVFKIATTCCRFLNNYMVFSDIDGIYSYTYAAERKEDCIACSNLIQTLTFAKDIKLEEVINYLKDSDEYQMKCPGIMGNVNGKSKTLFMKVISQTEKNLPLKLESELGILDGGEITVADSTTPKTITFRIKYEQSESITN